MSIEMKQIALGELMYAQDFDEILPAYGDYGCYYRGWGTMWWTMIQPYVKNTQLLTCPSDKNLQIGYGVNYFHVSACDAHPTHLNPSADLAKVKRPAEVAMVADSTTNIHYCLICYPQYSIPGITDRHNGGFNVAYCDGHAKWVKADRFLTAVTPGTPDYDFMATFYGHVW